jgi:hypothetical protein
MREQGGCFDACGNRKRAEMQEMVLLGAEPTLTRDCSSTREPAKVRCLNEKSSAVPKLAEASG